MVEEFVSAVIAGDHLPPLNLTPGYTKNAMRQFAFWRPLVVVPVLLTRLLSAPTKILNSETTLSSYWHSLLPHQLLQPLLSNGF